MPSDKTSCNRGQCEVCGLSPRKLAPIESGQLLCLRCRQKLRKASREYYAKPETVKKLRQLGFQVTDNVSKDEAERLNRLHHLHSEGGTAPEGASIIEIGRLLGIQIARRRGLRISDSISLAEVTKLTAERPIRHYHTNVVGVTFENEDGSDRQEILSRCRPLEPVRLEHDDLNRHHKNAVSVLRANGEQIGHLNRELADEVIAKSREGYTFSTFIKNLGGGPDSGQNYWAKLLILEGKPGATPIDAEEYEKHIDMSDAGWVN